MVKRTVLIEELSFGISIDADIFVQTQDLATPYLSRSRLFQLDAVNNRPHHHLPQPRLAPQPRRETCILHLKAIIYPHRLAALGLARRRRQRQRAEKIDVLLTQCRRPEVGDGEDLVGQ